MAGITELKRMALNIFYEALKSADPEEAVAKSFKVKHNLLNVREIDYSLNRFKSIYVIGAGKACARIARAIEQNLSERITEGIVIVKYGHKVPLKKIILREASHPVPDQAGIKATQKLISLAEKAGKDDLVINLLSGGASALMVAPAPGITLEDKQITTELMLKSGMRIDEINAVRKHISRVKGGQLAKILFPATIISLILSDVIGDRLEVIASGPTAPDPSTFSHAISLLKIYKIWTRVPASVRKVLMLGLNGKIPETPKPGDEIFKRVQNLIIGSNRISLEAAKSRAEKLGLNTIILSSEIQGDVREIAKQYGALFQRILKTGAPVKPPACIIAGGEPTVKVLGRGKGGRNQELALAVAMEIQGLKGALFLSAGTDGTDGPTDAAGAIADFETISRAKKLGLDPQKFLAENNSYNFFKPLKDLIITGPTGTNVMDIHILLIG